MNEVYMIFIGIHKDIKLEHKINVLRQTAGGNNSENKPYLLVNEMKKRNDEIEK